ncbi:hypothetical protein EDB86DRAFT_2830094 [Lactarius hatsudake]|nr:hypothetical protein EDB86DRAFT_2830094 [Lactarius hatsudake]
MSPSSGNPGISPPKKIIAIDLEALFQIFGFPQFPPHGAPVAQKTAHVTLISSERAGPGPNLVRLAAPPIGLFFFFGTTCYMPLSDEVVWYQTARIVTHSLRSEATDDDRRTAIEAFSGLNPEDAILDQEGKGPPLVGVAPVLAAVLKRFTIFEDHFQAIMAEQTRKSSMSTRCPTPLTHDSRCTGEILLKRQSQFRNDQSLDTVPEYVPVNYRFPIARQRRPGYRNCRCNEKKQIKFNIFCDYHTVQPQLTTRAFVNNFNFRDRASA